MKIKKIIIENVRGFRHIEIDLTGKVGVNNWTVFLGDNGVGKTTLLRCIALCLCEESGAAGLLDELHGEWIRAESNRKPARIRLEFEKVSGYSKSPFIETTIKYSKFGEIEVEQRSGPAQSKVWDKLFICGYGANRRAFGTTSYSEYTVVDAVYSLFNYETPLQNIELNFLRIAREKIPLNKLFRRIEEILLLERGSIRLERTGITVKGPWGSYAPTGTLGDGYQASLAWIMDMYGWKLLYERRLTNLEIEGIVIIDEIEQHLHPLWQKEIVSKLSEQFKKVQFFVATHSPVLALNSFKTRVNDPNSKLYYLKWDDDAGEKYIEISEVQEPVDELNYNQLLESEAFGHMLNSNSKVEKLLKQMSELASIDRPTKEQNSTLNIIKQELKQLMFPEGKSLIERIVEREYYKELEDKADYLQKILNKR
jgi:predicted ATPase